MDFAFEVSKPAKEAGYAISLKFSGHGANISKKIERNNYKSYFHINVPNPKLWWPSGYGEPNLYNYSVELIINGKVAEIREGKIGIREVRTVEKPFTPEAGSGYSFQLEVNGKPVLVKGSNWVPMETWPGTIKNEQYGYYIQRASEANFNMLRVWGGGIYEKEIFYDLCNELGLMVWQDFMFSSTRYPVGLLMDEIIAEANYQLSRLKNYSCIVTWCGINEDVYSWSYPEEEAVNAQADLGVYSDDFAQQKKFRLREDPIIYTMILRGLTTRYSLGVPYVQSSPESRDDEGNMINSGNSHMSAWKYVLFMSGNRPEKYREYFENVCSFDTEFAIQGPASVKTHKKFFSPKNYWPPNDDWKYHIQFGWREHYHFNQIIMIAGGLFGKINSLQEYVKLGQAAHMEIMRSEFEYARRDRPNNGGTMFWMLNDCWPTSNWSVIDYYKKVKPAFYSAKRACAPLLPVVFERGGKTGFFFSNETGKDFSVKLAFGQENISGQKKWQKAKSLKVKANTVAQFYSVSNKKLKCPSGDFLFVKAAANGKILPPVTYFPSLWKDVKWEEPEIEYKIVSQKQVKGKWVSLLRLKTGKYTRFCHLLDKHDDPEVIFSDNYFDMPAGSQRDIIVESKEKFGPDRITIGHWLTDWE